MAISNKVGPPVTGDDFYGRVEELRRAHAYLNSGHSLVLSAPRRIGKSSFAKRLIRDKKYEGWCTVYLDLEGVRTKDEFFEILIEEFSESGIWRSTVESVKSFANRLMEGIRSIGPVTMDFSKSDNDVNAYIRLGNEINHEMDTLIVIDELTLFLGTLDKKGEDAEDVAFFLNWLRSLRQADGSRIRWVFCGSVGLHNFTNMRHLSMTINDLLSFDFDELSRDEALGLVDALANSESLRFPRPMQGYLLDKIGWNIPYFIQLMFTHIKHRVKVNDSVDEKAVDIAFRKLTQDEELSTWSERLNEYNEKEEAARVLLNELSKSGGMTKGELHNVLVEYTGESPMKMDKEVSLLLNMLEHDGYIMRDSEGKRVFRSPLLKGWWSYKFIE